MQLAHDVVQDSARRLRELTQLDVQTQWVLHPGDLPRSEALNPSTWRQWSPAVLNDRDHIDWPAGQQILWLGQTVTIPAALQTYPLEDCILRLDLRWWAEVAEIFVDGTLVQEGDLYDCFGRILLSQQVQPGDEIAVALRLVSPGHDPGALVRSHLIYEPPALVDPGMVADELEVLQSYLTAFRQEDLPKLSEAVQQLDWTPLNNPQAFSQNLNQLRQKLKPWSTWLKQRRINWIGHAHLDMAWLWPVAETWEAAERTFESVLKLQAEFPELIYCHSSPALYAWMEDNRPAIFEQIKARVAEGRWEVAAGLWIEPEFNLISGEALVRQVLYGQRYAQEKFGVHSATAWLPDSFGFCWQLPQILKQGGIDYFVTQKLRWNDTTEFPHEIFKWKSPDGTEIFSLTLPPIGESITPVKMADYAQKWEFSTGVENCLWLPGVGDHGGGPTKDMLEVARRWQQSPVFPQLEPTTAEQLCRQVEAAAQDVPVWNDELYLELHRGCYTSHADQKRYNRRCEHLLTEAELFSSIATLLTDCPYPKAELEQAWKKVLFNQFHDILPGSAIPEVFEDANRDWEAAEQAAARCIDEALDAIASQISLPTPPATDAVPIIVFNSLNWQRSELASVQLPAAPSQWQIKDCTGAVVPSQHHRENTLLFAVTDIPSVGYQLYWLCPTKTPPEEQSIPENWVLENAVLKATVSPETGDLEQIYDKQNQRQVLSGPGNHLQFFTDKGQYWDAWNIDPNYANHQLPGAKLESIEWVSLGPLRQSIRVIRSISQSQFCQDYVLEHNAPLLKIETTVDWQERQVLVKAAFPLTVQSELATYEIPCGAIERPTLPNPKPLSEAEKAKWEVPALHWADLSDQSYGVSLLNDCKYGYDAQPDQLRLTLLRSPNWPDPGCDRGHHQFTYTLYTHAGSWQAARTVHRGYELNRGLRVTVLPTPCMTSDTQLSPLGQLLSLEAENLILMALKPDESVPEQLILRCYECHGKFAQMQCNNTLKLTIKQPVDLLERPLAVAEQKLEIRPWQICSWILDIDPK
ncbi:MAG: alpha-mannosidase [Cyanobacteria bacterium P01_A01_bin.17]